MDAHTRPRTRTPNIVSHLFHKHQRTRIAKPITGAKPPTPSMPPLIPVLDKIRHKERHRRKQTLVYASLISIVHNPHDQWKVRILILTVSTFPTGAETQTHLISRLEEFLLCHLVRRSQLCLIAVVEGKQRNDFFGQVVLQDHREVIHDPSQYFGIVFFRDCVSTVIPKCKEAWMKCMMLL